MNFHSGVNTESKQQEYTIVNYHDKLTLISEMSINLENEMTGTTSGIIKGFDKIRHGEHVVLIYPNLYALREINSHYCNMALKIMNWY